MNYSVAIIGARGAVGRELLSLLEKKNFPLSGLCLFGSNQDSMPFQDLDLPVHPLKDAEIPACDIAFFCATSEISKKYIPLFLEKGSLNIDLSSAFRGDPNVPLVIPEINAKEIAGHKGIIASPNCIVALLALVLSPLMSVFSIQKVIVTTYQAASGAGEAAMNSLIAETKEFLETGCLQSDYFPVPYAFNLFLHDSPQDTAGYTEEENKIIYEAKKILSAPNLSISPTCVRVPVLRAHSMSVHIQCRNPVDIKKVRRILTQTQGVCFTSDRFLSPQQAAGKEEILCGRARLDHFDPRCFELWIVGDQLLKGAALNAFQIAEHSVGLYQDSLLST
ncbi:MAG: aspartate-semialdehyde dehydrogenase [Simkaniaceae bacterium]